MLVDGDSPSRRFDVADFATVYREHQRSVHSTAYAICGPDLAADVTQETFLRLWRRPEQFDPERGSLRAFLMTIARNVAIDQLRTAQSRKRREDNDHVHSSIGVGHLEVDSTTIDGETRHQLLSALDRLQPAQRQAILTVCYGHCTYREAARILDTPEGTIKSRIRLGLIQLRRSLDASEMLLA